MTLNKLLFSSAKHNWQTPPELYKKLDDEFHFNWDVCTTPDNPLGAPSFIVGDFALNMPWSGTCYMNPPYGRHISKWIQKAYDEAIMYEHCIVVGLLPARTDTKWFHHYIYTDNPKLNHLIKIRFLKGRIKFVGAKNGAPFPSMIVIWRPPSK